MKEESGLDIKDPILRTVVTFPLFDGVDDWYVFIFSAYHFSGDLIDCAECELQWVDEALDKPSWDGDKLCVDWILSGKPFFISKMTYQNQKLVDYQVKFY